MEPRTLTPEAPEELSKPAPARQPRAGSKAKKDTRPLDDQQFDAEMKRVGGLGEPELPTALNALVRIRDRILAIKADPANWQRLSHFQRSVLNGALLTAQEVLGDRDEKNQRHSISKYLGINL